METESLGKISNKKSGHCHMTMQEILMLLIIIFFWFKGGKKGLKGKSSLGPLFHCIRDGLTQNV